MNRADLSWALTAVLPHAGKTAETAVVGLERRDSDLYVYASDRYSTGIAKIRDGADVRLSLPAREATDLMRFVRPAKVAEQTEDVAYAVQPGELHVGAGDDSAVFETVESELSLDYLLDFIDRLYAAPAEWEELIYQPDLAAKWAKAKRDERDRLRIFPRHVIDQYGAAVVTVGTDFIGAIAGLEYDQLGADIVSAFLTEGKAA